MSDIFREPKPAARFYKSQCDPETAAIVLELDGEGELIGDNPFALTGGVGAVWVRAKR
ncbi:MAG: hypothetical protein WAN03_09995 [Candidatus Sulfotelmatobacter sp.]